MKFNNFTNIAIESAQKGAEILLNHFCKIKNIEYKGRIDPVTIADKNSQEAIVNNIKQYFPLHNIIAEEKDTNLKSNESDYCWIIDPLDGTVNYIHGVPNFAVSIGLKYKEEIICGVIYAPALKEMFVGQKDKGAFLNNKKIHVSNIKDMIKALPVTGFPYYVKEKPNRVLKNFKNIMLETQGLRRLGSAALDLAYVACGRFDFFWEEGLKPWDIAAGTVIVKEAGGKITDFFGKKDFLFKDTLVASNNILHEDVLKVLNEARKSK